MIQNSLSKVLLSLSLETTQLGAFIQIPPDQQRVKDHLNGKLLSLLKKVDSPPVTRNQKLLLYNTGVCPRMLWDMRISDLSISWVTRQLEATVTHYLKKWSGLSRLADPSRLYLPKRTVDSTFQTSPRCTKRSWSALLASY